MKIATIEAIPVAYPEPNDNGALRHLCLVRMQADDGRVGWGEAITMWPEASSATKALIDGMAPLLIGRNPVESDALWRALKEHTWWYGVGGIASFAIAALDIAAWDLKGKALGASVLELLGGTNRERIPAIVSAMRAGPRSPIWSTRWRVGWPVGYMASRSASASEATPAWGWSTGATLLSSRHSDRQ